MNAKGRRKHNCSLWNQSGERKTVDCEATRISTPGIAAATKLWMGMGCCPHLPGILSSLVPLTHNPMPTPLGKHTTHLRLWRLPTDLCCGGYSSHTPTVSAFSLPLPSPTEQMSLNKLLLLPPHVWAGNCYQSMTYKQRRGQNQSEAPGLYEQRREGEIAPEPRL